MDTESYDSWLAFLRGVRARGASGVRLVVSDAHKGLVRALGDAFQGAAWRRCVVRPIRDCVREAGSWAARRHVPRGPRHAARGVPQGRQRAGGGGARRPGAPRLPAVALEEAQDQQRPGAGQQGDKAQVADGAGVPLGGVADQARGRRHVRPGRGVGVLQVLLRGQDARATGTRGGARGEAGPLGDGSGVRQAGHRGEPGARGQGGGQVGWRARFQPRGRRP